LTFIGIGYTVCSLIIPINRQNKGWWVLGRLCIATLLVVALLIANILSGCTGTSNSMAESHFDQGSKLHKEGRYNRDSQANRLGRLGLSAGADGVIAKQRVELVPVLTGQR